VSKPALYGDARRWGLVHADALSLLGQMPDASADCLLTDPPYAIGFAGHAWDGTGIREAVAGSGHLSDGEAFARWTSRWAAEVRRVLKPGGWLVAFGSPRTFHRLVCGIEDAGVEVRDTLLWIHGAGPPKSRRLPGDLATALKPSYEPIVLGRVPLQGSVAQNLSTWGTGALDIGAGRITHPEPPRGGFWPANLAVSHDEHCTTRRCDPDCPLALIDDGRVRVSRLFYCAKASRAEREAGCESLPLRHVELYGGRGARQVRNLHPTVKPVTLMRWLVRLASPHGGVVLDPFSGSGTSGVAALLEGRRFMGIERERDYIPVARARLAHWAAVAEGAG
jgi:site-specific DNA-methyltransferase (adenine-specific)